MIDEDGTSTHLEPREIIIPPQTKYTPAQLAQIDHVNTQLIEKGLPVMTEEESNYFIDPYINAPESTPDVLQRLAGFEVEKKLIKHDDYTDDAWIRHVYDLYDDGSLKKTKLNRS
jgi:hypothetical protein